MTFLAAIVRGADERTAIARAAGGGQLVKFCATCEQAARIVTPRAAGILYEYPNPGVADVNALIQLLADQPDPPPLIVFGRPNAAWARDLLTLCRQGLDVRAVIRGFDDLATFLREFRRTPPQPSPDVIILRELRGFLARPSLSLLVTAVISGKQRFSVRRLAQQCGLTLRTMQNILIRCRLPQARRIVGWCSSLHIIWRFDILRWPLKRTAGASGFGSSAALSSYVRRHTGATPTSLRDTIGFAGALDRFITMLGNTGGTTAS